MRKEATDEKEDSTHPFPGVLSGQHEPHSFELSMSVISSLGSRMEFGINSSAEKAPGTKGLGPAGLGQRSSSQDAGAQQDLSREIIELNCTTSEDPGRNPHIQTALRPSKTC